MKRSLLFLTLLASCSPTTTADSFLIVDAALFDGSGEQPRTASIRVAGDSIVELGTLTPLRGEVVVNGSGLAVAPGFIDTHSHATGDLREDTTALGAVSQGITTIVGGQDGGSVEDVGAFLASLDSTPAPVNVATYAGHGTIRETVLGEDYKRKATVAEVDSMAVLLRAQLRAGALGLSTGLEYDPGIYSATDEVLALARVVAAEGGRYISHIRSEDFAFWPAVNELIRIGRETGIPVQISHAKLAMRSLWGQADSLIGLLDRARGEGVDVTADIYPYLYWQSTLTVLFPKRDFENRKAANFALTETTTPGGLLLARYRPDRTLEGKTLAEIAALKGVDSVTALIDLIRGAQAMRATLTPDSGDVSVESIIATSMDEEDVARIMRWPHTNFCTDGGLTGRHPRGFGSFPRILGHYARTKGVITLEEAIRRSTTLAASHMGITDRGRIAPGMKADLVLFDPGSIIDRATPAEPHALSVGVRQVWVNGTTVYRDGVATGARAGRAIRRSSSSTNRS